LSVLTPDDVRAAVARRAGLVREYLADDAFLASVEPEHLRAAAGAYLARGGKGLRPAAVLFFCGAGGGEEQWALAAGAAVEVTHNWTLVHDDVIDRDDRRRGGPAVHAELARRGEDELGFAGDEARHYGLSMAVLAGDVGPCWAAHLVSRLPENGVTSVETAARIGNELATVTVPAILAGEAEDVQLGVRPLAETGLDAVESMMAKKTGALYEWCARAGATVAGAAPDVVAALGRFAAGCGTAFQHVDDTLAYTSDDGKTGKTAASDLREGKRTAVVLGAYENASADERRYIAEALGDPAAAESDINNLIEKLTALGGVAYARERAHRYYEEALKELEVLPPGEYRDLLAGWAEVLLRRTH
jgi:geranylgeranyl diphosphate synthase type I